LTLSAKLDEAKAALQALYDTPLAQAWAKAKAERDEARAELAEKRRHCIEWMEIRDKLRDDRDALRAAIEARYERDNAQRAFNGMLRAYGELRAAIEAHNARFTTTESDRIPLPPAAKENSDE
jgi:hypothetical protein